MENIVIGLGEVGTAIASILECEGIDVNQEADNKSYKTIHICFPYSENFVEYVKQYQEKYSPEYTIIHSSVPVGTSIQCNAVHSPVRGIHPFLEKGIRTFVKYFGGSDAYECAEVFKNKGIDVFITPSSNDTEALKLWDTTQYGLNILIEKEIHKFCKENQLDFDLIYTQANITYNKGYNELGYPQFTKYVLEHREGEIGGHCVIPNSKLIDSPLSELLWNTKN